MKQKAIILSGGWGYGNLGDDAILQSSVKMLRHRFGDKPIVILSFDVEESKEVVPKSESISYMPSLHGELFGKRESKATSYRGGAFSF